MSILLSVLVVEGIILSVIGILIYRQLSRLGILQANTQAKEFKEAVENPKVKKNFLPLKKETVRGRSITETEDLVDFGDVPFEEGFEALTGIKVKPIESGK